MGILHRGREIVRRAIWATAMVMVAAPFEARAQRGALTETYGRGVHDYFAGRYHEARERFTSAINAGSRDPRAYYFRGLTLRALGEAQLADEDFRQAAGLENSPAGRSVNVGRALERVQGSDRLHLERFRRDARLSAARPAAPVRRTFEEPPPRSAGVGTSSGVLPANSTADEAAPSRHTPPIGPPAVQGGDIGPSPSVVPALELPKDAGAAPVAASEPHTPETQVVPTPLAPPSADHESSVGGIPDFFRQAVDNLFDSLSVNDGEPEGSLPTENFPAEEFSTPADETTSDREGSGESLFNPTTPENRNSNAEEEGDPLLDESGDANVFNASGSEYAEEGAHAANPAGQTPPRREPRQADAETFETEPVEEDGDLGDLFAPLPSPDPPTSDSTSPAGATPVPARDLRGPAERPVTAGEHRDVIEADLSDDDFFSNDSDFAEPSSIDDGEEAGSEEDPESFFTEETP